jgi:hypothetical protein
VALECCFWQENSSFKKGANVQERIGITFPGIFGTLPTAAIKKEFLLKFARDRRLWIQWLFAARKRCGLSALNYTLTSNHIHLLIRDNGEIDVIPNSVQLNAGREGAGPGPLSWYRL